MSGCVVPLQSPLYSCDTFGKRLRWFRRSVGASQKEIAAMLYVYQTTVAAWENDRNEPSISAIVKLARYYNVHVDHLLGLDDTSVYDLWGVQEA